MLGVGAIQVMFSFVFGSFLPSCKHITGRTEFEMGTLTKRNKIKTQDMDMKHSRSTERKTNTNRRTN
jgi:hypothetical protein